MTVLNLGVIDVPYTVEVPQKVRRAVHRVARGDGKDRAPKTHTAAPAGGETTGDVASILEAEYGVMAFFWERHGQEIADLAVSSMAGAAETVMMGGVQPDDLFVSLYPKIEKMFRDFLDAMEMDGQPGVPTQAALEGVNHRLKLKRGDPRPSFIDTGIYQASFKAWLEGQIG